MVGSNLVLYENELNNSSRNNQANRSNAGSFMGNTENRNLLMPHPFLAGPDDLDSSQKLILDDNFD
jgi:hypothetical protein